MLIIKTNQDAKNIINSFSKLKNDIYVNQWLKETNGVFCVLKFNDNYEIICFALMHLLDYDPLHLHIKPVYLDYIYTFNKYKRQGYASSLLLKIIKKNTITAFCNNDQSVLLFRKCGFSVINNLARFPPIEENNDNINNINNMLLETLNNYKNIIKNK